MTERNDDCNVGAEHFPTAKEHAQNDKTRSHSGKLSNLIGSCFFTLKTTMITKTTNEVIMNKSRKPEK